jgi:hypothetical protein
LHEPPKCEARYPTIIILLLKGFFKTFLRAILFFFHPVYPNPWAVEELGEAAKSHLMKKTSNGFNDWKPGGPESSPFLNLQKFLLLFYFNLIISYRDQDLIWL